MTTTAPPRIDPRIRERRITVTREQGRRRLRVVLLGLGLVSLGLAGWGATRSPLLDVDTVTVSGAAHTRPDAVIRAGGLERGRLMAEIDPAAAARKIEALPWIDSATVRRQWPATVRITVAERTAAAVVETVGGGWAVVDVTGRVLETSAEPAPELPRVVSPAPVAAPGTRIDPAVRGAIAVAAALGPELAPRVADIALEHGSDSVELRLAPPKPGAAVAKVRFGPPRLVNEKLLALRTVLDKADLRDMTVLDLRVPEAPVLTRGSR